jgi:hypothetical protein
MRPTPQQIQMLARVTRQYPEFVEWLDAVRTQELDSLPYVVNNPALAQGRCQVLTEILKLVKDAPNLAAR